MVPLRVRLLFVRGDLPGIHWMVRDLSHSANFPCCKCEVRKEDVRNPSEYGACHTSMAVKLKRMAIQQAVTATGRGRMETECGWHGEGSELEKLLGCDSDGYFDLIRQVAIDPYHCFHCSSGLLRYVGDCCETAGSEGICGSGKHRFGLRCACAWDDASRKLALWLATSQ